MKRIIVVGILLAGWISLGNAATRGDVKVLEASDVIIYQINDLTKNYLLYAKFPHKRELLSALKADMIKLGKSFQEIAITTKDPKTKGLLAFFAHQKARDEEILEQNKPTKKSLSEVLEISESFVEGADAIARHHAYDFSPEERMFALTRSIQQHMEGITKYYVARQIIIDNPDIDKALRKEIARIKQELNTINQYQYPDPAIAKIRDRVNAIWKSIVPYLERFDQQKGVPVIMSMATKHMVTMLQSIGIYHSQNQ